MTRPSSEVELSKLLQSDSSNAQLRTTQTEGSPHTPANSSGVSPAVMAHYRTDSTPRSFERKWGPCELHFNPVVSFISIFLIWLFVIGAIVWQKEMNSELGIWKVWIRETFTWFYVGSINIWLVFVAVIYFSKYAKIRLGKDDELPEFSDTSYFTMLFAAGIGPGLFYFAVAEPINHYRGLNHFTIDKALTDNHRASLAMTQTFLHWGLHAWTVYVVVGMLLAFMSFRYDLPMTIRTCFFPLLGSRIFGPLGDVIDVFSVICAMFGVCTTLGLGVLQLNSGLNRIFPSIGFNTLVQTILIWVITAVATISVVSGMKAGIQLLSLICFVIGLLIMFIIFFCENSFFILNALVQNVGLYCNNLIKLGSFTDGYGQMNNSIDGVDAPNWMDDWTIFYWGFWVSWSPFVGMFIAKISRGRTIKDFIFYTLTIPCIYIFIWFSVFGNASINMERKADHLGINCSVKYNDSGTIIAFDHVGPIYKLSCRNTVQMLFDVMEQYEGLEYFLSGISMISLVLYFVTSSDSGSMIIDCLTANGNPEPPVAQRIFWALTEGACATALLIAGGEDALRALKSVMICAGLVYTLVLNFMCLALWRSLAIEAGDITHTPEFVGDLVNPFYQLHHLSKPSHVKMMVLAVIAPWYRLSFVAKQVYVVGKRRRYMAIMALPFFIAIALLVASRYIWNLAYVSASFYLLFVIYVTGIRSVLRERYNIVGNIVEDFFTILMLYPLATIQMDDQIFYVDNTQTMATDQPTSQRSRPRPSANEVNLVYAGYLMGTPHHPAVSRVGKRRHHACDRSHERERLSSEKEHISPERQPVESFSLQESPASVQTPKTYSVIT